MDTADNELNKLCAYKQKEEITEQDIELMCPKHLDAMVFELAKAVIKGDSAQVFRLIGIYRWQREEPTAVLGALANNFIDMYRVKAGEKAGRSPGDIHKEFGYRGSPYRLNYVQRDCAGVSIKYLKTAIYLLCDCDKKLKSLSVDGFTLIEELAAQLLILRQTTK